MMLHRFVISAGVVVGAFLGLLGSPDAAFVGSQRVFTGNPGGAIPAPTLTIECRTGLNLSSVLTVSRASVELADDLSGIWHSFANNVLAQTNKGCSAWEARTNGAIHNRDFTNASWVKTNISASLNATGVDNTSNSASTLTASAGNATVLQAITNASSTRQTSAFVQRKTGTGEIDITQDGGTTWTAITPCSSGTFIGLWSANPQHPNCRFTTPVQVVTNPSVGFRIVTNGDAIVVDGFQEEVIGASANATISPPIFTTTAAVTRALDQITVTSPPSFSSNFAFAATAQRTVYNAQSFSSQFSITFGGTSSNRVGFTSGNGFQNFNEALSVVIVGGGAVGTSRASNQTPLDAPWTSVAQLQPNMVAKYQYDGTYGATGISGASLPSASTIYLGSLNTAQPFDGYVQKINLWVNPGGNTWSKTQLTQAANMTR